jgi:hypothetical protein
MLVTWLGSIQLYVDLSCELRTDPNTTAVLTFSSKDETTKDSVS